MDNRDRHERSRTDSILFVLLRVCRTAEDLLLAMRDQLTAYASASDAPNGDVLVKSETDARQQLVSAKAKLSKFEKLFGPEADSGGFATKLQQADERVKVLEAQLKSGAEASNMLYNEIDRLSSAWSTLDQQNAAKVWNLTHTEEKIQKLSIEVSLDLWLSWTNRGR